jgi:hypothetical protein
MIDFIISQCFLSESMMRWSQKLSNILEQA